MLSAPMERTIYADLLEWKNNPGRKPLILEGVRQCGKTYILNKFGEQEYEDVAYFLFDKNPPLQKIFYHDLDPKRIIHELSLHRNKKIESGKTLIIFDEIQSCGNALTSLKFFYEDVPEYHIVCAGSLLGVMMHETHSFPVGKVDSLMMHPMTFKEFLLANSEKMLVEDMEANYHMKGSPESLTGRLNKYLDYYFIIGGMPAAVASWTANKDIREVDRILGSIIRDYKKDFSKYATEDITKLTLIWDSVPVQLAKENNKFIFSHVKTGARSKDLEDALTWLVNAGLVHKVRKVDPPKAPLAMFADNTSFKVYLADIGILRKMTGMSTDFIFSEDKEYDAYRGAAAENFVLNELIASIGVAPFYWRSGFSAEVDFIIQVDGTVVPIDAKAGNSKAKSLTEFITKYGSKIAITTSNRNNRSGVVVHIPLYAVWKLQDIVRNKVPPRNLFSDMQGDKNNNHALHKE
jgi:predicted AAA+ superfamily ATPase